MYCVSCRALASASPGANVDRSSSASVVAVATTAGMLAPSAVSSRWPATWPERHELHRGQHLVFEPATRHRPSSAALDRHARTRAPRARTPPAASPARAPAAHRAPPHRGARDRCSSFASEPPICSVSARSSAVSRDARNQRVPRDERGQSSARAARSSRQAIAASPRATTRSSTSPIHAARRRRVADDRPPRPPTRAPANSCTRRSAARARELQQAHERQTRRRCASGSTRAAPSRASIRHVTRRVGSAPRNRG